jgi:hypothetical protein
MTGEFHPIRVDQTRGLIVLQMILLLLGLLAALICLPWIADPGGLFVALALTLVGTSAVLALAAALMARGLASSWILALLGQLGAVAVAIEAVRLLNYLLLPVILVTMSVVWITMNLLHPNVRIYLLTGVDPRR